MYREKIFRAHQSTAAKLYNFPRQLTAFVGREADLSEITRLLSEPHCGLLTLVGPGGIGKTRLALQSAAAVADQFAAGVCFVPLQAVTSPAYLISAMIDALGLPQRGQSDPAILLDYLSDKDLLLVLDNFEQLVPSVTTHSETDELVVTDLLADILLAAPSVKIVVTSRATLNLQEEWLYPVPGLPYPKADKADESWSQVKDYSAVQLFIERAGRVRRDFDPAAEWQAVVRICRLIEGVPLALEMAAAWTRTMSCHQIAAEIQRNLDFLTSDMRNVPDRQRSLQAVFDYSWQLLSAVEQRSFKRLAVFRGGFRREAAENVAGATLPVLSALVDKSLLRWDPGGRYQIHELLRQYAAEQLLLSQEDMLEVYQRHSRYYAERLQQLTPALEGADQQAAVAEVAAELDNVRAAWRWAVQQRDIDSMTRATYPYYLFCDFQGRYQEGADIFELAVEQLAQPEPNRAYTAILSALHCFVGYHYLRLGRLDAGRDAFSHALAGYETRGELPPPGLGTDPLNGLALLANILGDFREATHLGKEIRQRAEARGDQQNMLVAFYVLTDAAMGQGDVAGAQDYALRNYTLSQTTGNRWMMAYILGQLGNIARLLGDYEEARNYYQAYYSLKEALSDPEGMAAARNELARVALLEKDLSTAAAQFQQSQTIYHEIKDRGGLARSLYGLGDVALASGELAQAAQHYHTALQVAADMQWPLLTLSILGSIGEHYRRRERLEQAVELQRLVASHQASDYETKTLAQARLAQLQADMPKEQFAAAQSRQLVDLDLITRKIQADLAAQPAQKPASTATKPSPKSDELVEQLTPREVEVLQQIAAGLTNQDIANTLIISVGTVKFYTSQIYGKLSVGNRTQAVVRGRELGLLA